MQFRHDIRQWPTAFAFRSHLDNYDPSIAPWAKGIVVHHTVSPTPASWRGHDTMVGMMNYYKGLKWESGPHLFIVTGAKNPAHDGIWQMTALNEKGTHAGACNSSTWGVEVVGFYDTKPWSLSTMSLVLDALHVLSQWRGITITKDTLKGHRDCNSPKTCPGRAVDMQIIREAVKRKAKQEAGDGVK
jgi:hypothetical protein